MKEIAQLQFITNGNTPSEHLSQVKEACEVGVDWIQLRIKNIGEEQYIQTAKLAKEICQNHQTKLIINDKVLVAAAARADGIHLGKQDMPPLEAKKILGKEPIIGGTANTWEDIQYLALQQVDYIGLGPFRFTATKKKLSPILGLEGYQSILQKMKKNQIKIPIIAIGGIELNDIPSLLDIGVYGIAISSLFCTATDKAQIFRQINQKLKENAG